MYEETKGVGVNNVFLGSTKIATVSSNQVRYYFQDHLGSANVVTDAAGSMIELMEYKPFGDFSRHVKYGGNENVAWYYFTGKPLDDETGLIFYGARYYSPILGRFLTPDTIVQSPGDPQTLNRYTYCNNNPVNLVDPTGYSWFSKLFKAIGQFFSNVVQHPIQTLLATVTVAVGIFTGNPFLVASGVTQYINIGTSSWQGGGWSTFHQVTGYLSMALAVAGAFYSPAGPPSAELGYDSAGNYVGTVTLDKIQITKIPAQMQAARMAQLGRTVSTAVATVETGLNFVTDFTKAMVGQNALGTVKTAAMATRFAEGAGLIMMLNPVTVPFGATVITAAGIDGLAFDITADVMEGQRLGVLTDIGGFALGFGTGKMAARAVTGLTVDFNQGAMRYMGKMNGHFGFVKSAVGRASTQVENAAGSILGSIWGLLFR